MNSTGLYLIVTLLLVVCLCGCDGDGSATGGATPGTANMRSPRVAHTQTLLQDGRVLIAGGVQDVKSYLPPANYDLEIFDPKTGRLSVVGKMKTVRTFHTATLLADGRVVFIGGTMAEKVEIFDPATGRLEDGGRAIGLRIMHTATLMPDGEILIVGGLDPGVGLSRGKLQASLKHWHRSIVLYDPVAKTSRLLPIRMRWARRGHTATLLDDHTVLMLGGTHKKDTEIIDVRDETIRMGPRLSQSREDHRTTVLHDGTLFITGGTTYGGRTLNTAVVFDPAEFVFHVVPGKMVHAREDHTADLLPDGRVVLSGGEDNERATDRSDIVLRSAEVYDPRTGVFTALPDMVVYRDDHASCVLNTGIVLVTGGADQDSIATNSVETVAAPPLKSRLK